MTEPKKPRITNLKLITVGIYATGIGALVFLVLALTGAAGNMGLLWVYLGMISLWVILRHTKRIIVYGQRVWELAQWKAMTGIVKDVTVNVTQFRYLIGQTQASPALTSIDVTLEDDQSLTVPWSLFNDLVPSERLSYESRVLNGQREYRGVAKA